MGFHDHELQSAHEAQFNLAAFEPDCWHAGAVQCACEPIVPTKNLLRAAAARQPVFLGGRN